MVFALWIINCAAQLLIRSNMLMSFKRKSFQLGYGCMMVAVKCVSGVTLPLQNGPKKRMIFSITTVGSSKTLNAIFLKTFGTLR